jgi:hypothetical protein
MIDIREKGKKVGVFKCPICSSKIFKSKEFLENHMQRRHTSTLDPNTAVLVNEDILERAEKINFLKKKIEAKKKENALNSEDINSQKSDGSIRNNDYNLDLQKIIEKLDNLEILKRKEVESENRKNNDFPFPPAIDNNNFNFQSFEEKFKEIINNEFERLENGMKKNLDEKVRMMIEQSQKEKEDLVKSAISSDFRPYESALTERHQVEILYFFKLIGFFISPQNFPIFFFHM